MKATWAMWQSRVVLGDGTEAATSGNWFQFLAALILKTLNLLCVPVSWLEWTYTLRPALLVNILSEGFLA